MDSWNITVPPIHYFPTKQTISRGFGRSALLRYTHVGLKLYQVGPIFWVKITPDSRFSFVEILRIPAGGHSETGAQATGTKLVKHQSTNTPCGFGAWQFFVKIYRFEANIYRFSDLILISLWSCLYVQVFPGFCDFAPFFWQRQVLNIAAPTYKFSGMLE